MSKVKDILKEYKDICNEIDIINEKIQREPIEDKKEELWQKMSEKRKERDILQNVIDGPLKEAFIEAVKSKSPEMKKKFLDEKKSEIDNIDEKINKVDMAIKENGYRGYKEIFSRMISSKNVCTYEQLNEKIDIDNGEKTTVYDEMLKVNQEDTNKYENMLIEFENKKNKLDKEITKSPNNWQSKEEYINSRLDGDIYKLTELGAKLSRNICYKFAKSVVAVKLAEKGTVIINGKEITTIEDSNIKTNISTAEHYSWNEYNSKDPVESLESDKKRIQDFIGDENVFAEKYIEESLKYYVRDLERYKERKEKLQEEVDKHDNSIDEINQDKLFDQQLTADNKEEYIGKIVELSVDLDEIIKLKTEEQTNQKDRNTLEDIKKIENEYIEINKKISIAKAQRYNLEMEKRELKQKMVEIQKEISSTGTQLEPITARSKNIFTKLIGMIKGDKRKSEELVDKATNLEKEKENKNEEDRRIEAEILNIEKEIRYMEEEKENRSRNIDMKMSSEISQKYSRIKNTEAILDSINESDVEIEKSIRDILDKQPLLEEKSEEELIQIRGKLKIHAEKLKNVLSAKEIEKARKEYSYNKEIDMDDKMDGKKELDVDSEEVEETYSYVKYQIEDDYKKHIGKNVR